MFLFQLLLYITIDGRISNCCFCLILWNIYRMFSGFVLTSSKLNDSWTLRSIIRREGAEGKGEGGTTPSNRPYLHCAEVGGVRCPSEWSTCILPCIVIIGQQHQLVWRCCSGSSWWPDHVRDNVENPFIIHSTLLQWSALFHKSPMMTTVIIFNVYIYVARPANSGFMS